MSLIRKIEKAGKTHKTFGVRLPVELVERLEETRKICRELGYEFTLNEELERTVSRLLDKTEPELAELKKQYLAAVAAKAKGAQ